MLGTPSLIKLFDKMADGVLIVDAKWNIVYANGLARCYLNLSESADKIREDLIPKLSKRFVLSTDLSDIAEQDEKSIMFEADTLPNASYDLALSLYMSRATEEGLRFLLMRNVTNEKREEMCKRNFLSLISHKIGTPISVIKMGLETLAEGIAGPISKKQSEIVDKGLKKIAQLESIVKRLIDYTALQAKVHAGEIETLDAIKFAEEYCGRRAARHPKSVLFEFCRGTHDANVRAHKKMLETALENIIDNAIKFSHREKVAVRVEGVRESVTGGFILAIHDDGPGIPPTIRQDIFKTFTQHEKRFTGNVEGLGLGLAMVHSIMTILSGSVSIESSEKDGTTVKLFFPKVLE